MAWQDGSQCKPDVSNGRRCSFSNWQLGSATSWVTLRSARSSVIQQCRWLNYSSSGLGVLEFFVFFTRKGECEWAGGEHLVLYLPFPFHFPGFSQGRVTLAASKWRSVKWFFHFFIFSFCIYYRWLINIIFKWVEDSPRHKASEEHVPSWELLCGVCRGCQLLLVSVCPCTVGEPVVKGDKIVSLLKITRRGEIECKQPCRLFLSVPCGRPHPPGAGATLRVTVGEAVTVMDKSSVSSIVNCKQRDVCECIQNEGWDLIQLSADLCIHYFNRCKILQFLCRSSWT